MADPHRGGDVNAIRAVLLTAGLAVVAYGSTLLGANPPIVIVRILAWALGAAVIHDAVFAPLCALAGFTGRKLLPARWRAPMGVAGLCSVVLLLLAVPVYDKPGRRPDNMTVLNRDYHAGLWISLALVWVSALVFLVGSRRLPVRKDKVVQGQSPDGVGGQPPPP
jgi:hypothetical protein